MLNKRLLRLVPGIYASTAKAVFFKWLTLICSVIATFAICSFFNGIYTGNKAVLQTGIKTTLIIVISILFKCLFTKTHIKVSADTSQKAKKALREQIFNKLCTTGASYNNNISTAEAVQVSVEGIDQLEVYFSQYMPQLFYSLASVVTLFIVFSFFSFKTALVLIVCVPLIPLSIIGVQRFAKKLLSKYWTSYTNLGDTFLENIQGLTTLKIYGSDEKKHREMNRNAELFRKATMRVLIMQLNSISIMDIVAFEGSALGIILSISELSKGNITFFAAIVIILLSAEFFIPLRQLGSFFHVAMNGAAAAEKIFRILDIKEDNNSDLSADILNSSIKFENVSFSYDSTSDTLHNINFEFASKGLFALAGKSGCGKSTIASLLTGRQKNYKGSITIGGAELKNISEKKLMNNITFVSHNSHIFKGTVAYNLLIAKENASENEMLSVLKKVNLLDFINSEKGLETLISENGSNLSGGQKQRLAIARALLHNTPIYIFDEATSNIDTESEENIMEVIAEISKDKSVILISHRLANIVNSDKICVLNNGVLTEQGTHSELISNNSHYAQMFLNQYELEKYRMGGKTNE